MQATEAERLEVHVYVLLNGDSFKGSLRSYASGSNTILTEEGGRVITIPWSAVAYRETL
jgi:hypothetical protein